MKIARYKKAQRVISFYINNYGFHYPLHLIIDATFCHAALQNQIDIKDQIPKYLQTENVRMWTTQCIIVEAEKLGKAVQVATKIVKKFIVIKCGHEKEPVDGASCIKSLLKQNKYVLCSQDRELQDWCRTRPGQPILYLHQNTPVLEDPSDKSRKVAHKKVHKQLSLQDTVKSSLDSLKKREGIAVPEKRIGFKKKKTKNPNPLSCKKKKKKPGSEKKTNDNHLNMKPRRPRIKLAKHIKDVIKTSD